jgi:hypothetical protein
LGDVLTTPSREKTRFCITIGLFYLDEMLPLEIKHSGSKLLPHSDLQGGGECFQREDIKVLKSGKGIFG